MYNDDLVERFLHFVLGELQEKHVPVPISDDYHLTERDLLTDLKLIAEDLFDGIVRDEENMISVHFKNGQVFNIFAKEAEFPTE